MAVNRNAFMRIRSTVSRNTAALKSPFEVISYRENTHHAFISAKDMEKLSRIKSFREPLKKCLDTVIVPSIIEQFNRQGRPPWVELKASTKARRARKKFGKLSTNKKSKVDASKFYATMRFKILDETGRLMRVARQKNLWTIKSDELMFNEQALTSRVPYGKFHQTGTRFMPARPFVNLRWEHEEEIVSIFDNFQLDRIIKGWTTSTIGN